MAPLVADEITVLEIAVLEDAIVEVVLKTLVTTVETFNTVVPVLTTVTEEEDRPPGTVIALVVSVDALLAMVADANVAGCRVVWLDAVVPSGRNAIPTLMLIPSITATAENANIRLAYSDKKNSASLHTSGSP